MTEIPEKYNRLTLVRRYIDYDHKDVTQRHRADFICDCGNEVNGINYRTVTRGSTKSCGCLRRDNFAKIGKARRKHPFIQLRDLWKNEEHCRLVFEAVTGRPPGKLFGVYAGRNHTYLNYTINQVYIHSDGLIVYEVMNDQHQYNPFTVVELLKSLYYVPTN